jgi:hypothetical protein
VKTRSSAQIRSHAQKYIIKLCKKFNIHDSKQLKTLKNLKKGSKGEVLGIVDNLCLLGQNKFTEEDIANLDMEQIEEAILGIFKTSGLGSGKKNEICNINSINFDFSGDEANDQSEDKKKLFETIKEPKSKKKKLNTKGKVFQTQPGNLWPINKDAGMYNYLMMNQGQMGGQELANFFMRSQMAQIGTDPFNQNDGNLKLMNLLNLTRNDNSLLTLNNNLIQNIIGTDYNTHNIPLLNNNIFNNINNNQVNQPKSTSITTQENETGCSENVDDLAKLQNLQLLSDVMKILSNNNQLNGSENPQEIININNIDPQVLQLIGKLNSEQTVNNNEKKEDIAEQNNMNIAPQENFNFMRNQPTQDMGFNMANPLNNLSSFSNFMNTFNSKTQSGPFNQFASLMGLNPYLFNSANPLADITNTQGFPMNMFMPQMPMNIDFKNLMPNGSNNLDKVENKVSDNVAMPFQNLNEQYMNIMNQLLLNNSLSNQFNGFLPNILDDRTHPKMDGNK